MTEPRKLRLPSLRSRSKLATTAKPATQSENSKRNVELSPQFNITTLKSSIPSDFNKMLMSSSFSSPSKFSSSNDNSRVLKEHPENHTFSSDNNSLISEQSTTGNSSQLVPGDNQSGTSNSAAIQIPQLDTKKLLRAEIVTTKRLQSQITNLKSEKFKLETKLNLLKSVVARAVEMDKENHNLKKSLNAASSELQSTSPDQPGNADTHRLLESYMKEEDLDSDFVKAQMDSAILKSIVNPLELEIEDLRRKVKHYEHQLNITEELKNTNKNEHFEKYDVHRLMTKYKIDEQIPESYNISKLIAILSDMATCLNDKFDFHAFSTALLNNNENICEENEILKRNIKKMQAELNSEKEKYSDLQNTWKKANETFVEQSLTMTKQLEEVRRLQPQNASVGNRASSERNIASQTHSLFEDDGNSDIDNLITTLENDKKKLHKKCNSLKDENTNLHDAVLRQKAQIAELVTHLNTTNHQMHELCEKHQRDYARLESVLVGIESILPEHLKTHGEGDQEFLDPLGASVSAGETSTGELNTIDSSNLPSNQPKSLEHQFKAHSMTINHNTDQSPSPLQHASSAINNPPENVDANSEKSIASTPKPSSTTSQQILPSNRPLDLFGELLSDFQNAVLNDTKKSNKPSKYSNEKTL